MKCTTRRELLGGIGLIVTGLCSAQAQSTAKPITIGCMTALAGAQEVCGRPILTGAQIAADQINAAGGVLGRPIEIRIADCNADLAVAVQQTRQVGHQGINLLLSGGTSDCALAVSPELQPANAVMISCLAQTAELTHEAFVPNFFRVTDQTYMRCRAQGHLVAGRHPDIAAWSAILPDNEYGQSSWAAFHDGLMEADEATEADRRAPSMSEPVQVRPGEMAFRSHIATLQQQGSQALFIAVGGDDGVEFYRQASRAGLLSRMRVLADPSNELSVPQRLGHETPEHLWLAMSWYHAGYRTTPMGRHLYDDYLRRTGNAMPPGFLSSGHAAVHAYAAAIEMSGSTETAAVIKGLEGLTFDTAKGAVTFRPDDHQAICDVNFVRVKSSDQSLALDIDDGERPDIEIAEFVRVDGAGVIEPPAPGRKLTYHFQS